MVTIPETETKSGRKEEILRAISNFKIKVDFEVLRISSRYLAGCRHQLETPLWKHSSSGFDQTPSLIFDAIMKVPQCPRRTAWLCPRGARLMPSRLCASLGLWIWIAALSLRSASRDYAMVVHAEPAVATVQSASRPGRPGGVKPIYFCRGGCVSPKQGGSHVDSLVAARGPSGPFSATGFLRYAVPNHGVSHGSTTAGGGGGGNGDGDSVRPFPLLVNADEMRNSVAILHRGGGVSIVDKVLQAQEAGAVAAVVIDDGRCVGEEFLYCGRAAGTAHRGFGTSDHWSLWARVSIPCVLVTEAGGARLRDAMRLERVDLGTGLGLQYIDAQSEDALPQEEL